MTRKAKAILKAHQRLEDARIFLSVHGLLRDSENVRIKAAILKKCGKAMNAEGYSLAEAGR